jgi:hypothetical protein
MSEPRRFEVEGVEYVEGQHVSVMASFHGQSPRRVSGTLILVKRRTAAPGDLVYIETAFGAVEGLAATLESEE